MKIYILPLIVSLLASFPTPSAQAQQGPEPGDIYREFSRHNGGNKDWRVTDVKATVRFPRADAFLPNPRLELVVDDLEHAVRAEAILDRWGGHRGTINKRIRFNDHAWLAVPELTGTPDGVRPEMLMFQDNPVIEVPLDQLVTGQNVFEANCDEAGGFGWGQWGLYSLILRVYYDREKKNESLGIAAAITSPESGETILDDPLIRIDATANNGVSRVDVLAAYDGYDEDGDGVFGGWHKSRFQPLRGAANELRDHVGTIWKQPYSLSWNTHWVPDQRPNGIWLVARVQDTRGYWTVTRPVSRLTLRRDDVSVQLYRSQDVPEDFGVRVNQQSQCKIPIPSTHELERAVEAALHVRTWHGADTEHNPLRVNDHSLSIGGNNHHYDYDLLPFPPSVLRSGENQFIIHSETEHHQLEVLWPGPAVVVRYAKQPPSRLALGPTAQSPNSDRAAEKQSVYARYALRQPGDATKGRLLFLDQQRTKCATCHKVGNEGGLVGPDLSKIGGKFDRPHLVESLLEPSRQIVEGFRTSTVVTADGRTASGIVFESNDESILLVDAEANQHRIRRKDIDSLTPSTASLMPLGIADALSKAEFTDLVAYLETLRTGDARFGSAVSGPISLPAGFEIETITTGLTGATALEALPDGRILVCEQVGRLRVVKQGKLLDEPMLTLAVDNNWERGLIGVTVAPDFKEEPYVYVCYVAKSPYTHHRISRFRVEGDRVIPGSEEILLRGDDQAKLGGKVPAGHQGGGLHFGKDGKLYVGIGEQTAETPAQHLDTFQGKLLRINRDGTIPADNPFMEKSSGKYRAIWARGCRNPFTFAVHPRTGDLYINDVGGKYEEINVGVAGANYGWPVIDHGTKHGPGYVGPIHIYPQASISGGDFAPKEWEPPFGARYFFADFVHGWIKTIDTAAPESAESFASGLRRPVDLRFAVDGSLYVLLRNAWVIDGKFEEEPGPCCGFTPPTESLGN